jgi:hypothetical protein
VRETNVEKYLSIVVFLVIFSKMLFENILSHDEFQCFHAKKAVKNGF